MMVVVVPREEAVTVLPSVCSMSCRGKCWDNAVAERFFASVKIELVHDGAWAARAAARYELFEYLAVFYNGGDYIRPLATSAPSVRTAAGTRSAGNVTHVSTTPRQ